VWLEETFSACDYLPHPQFPASAPSLLKNWLFKKACRSFPREFFPVYPLFLKKVFCFGQFTRSEYLIRLFGPTSPLPKLSCFMSSASLHHSSSFLLSFLLIIPSDLLSSYSPQVACPQALFPFPRWVFVLLGSPLCAASGSSPQQVFLLGIIHLPHRTSPLQFDFPFISLVPFESL